MKNKLLQVINNLVFKLRLIKNFCSYQLLTHFLKKPFLFCSDVRKIFLLFFLSLVNKIFLTYNGWLKDLVFHLKSYKRNWVIIVKSSCLILNAIIKRQ